MGVNVALPGKKRLLDIGDGQATRVQRALAKRGLAKYETETMATTLALLDCLEVSHPVFFDVGAHVGVYALTVTSVHPQVAKVVSFEPTPNTYRIGEEIRSLNKLDFLSLQIALSDQDGTATLHISQEAETSNSLTRGFKPSSHAVTIETRTLDGIVAELGLAPDVLKIDVEAYEQPVILGGIQTIRKCRPDIVIELLATDGRYKIFFESEVWHEMAALGYRAYHINPAIPWRQTHRDDRFNNSRDWLLTTEPLRKKFWRRYIDWRYELSLCTPRRAERTAEAQAALGSERKLEAQLARHLLSRMRRKAKRIFISIPKIKNGCNASFHLFF